jgi:putative Mn2+ efflux pump MntP
MPLAGFFLGSIAGEVFGIAASVLGALLIQGLGGKMIYNVFEGTESILNVANIKSWRLYLLALSVSLDAWSVGFSLGTAACDIFQAVLIMGLTAGIMTGTGLVLGSKLGTGLGGNAQMLGGCILVGIGMKMSIAAFF